MVLQESPYCHRPFEARLLSKEEIDSAEATKVSDFGITGMILDVNKPTRDAIALHPDEIITHRMTYKCNHCVKEWTRITRETKELPREYVLDEE